MQASWDIEEVQAKGIQHLASFVKDKSGKALFDLFIYLFCSFLAFWDNKKGKTFFLCPYMRMNLLSSYFSRAVADGIVLILVLCMLLLTSRGVLLDDKNGHWGEKNPKPCDIWSGNKLTFEEGNFHQSWDDLGVIPGAARLAEQKEATHG